MERGITYVGLDVHKDTIAVALAKAGKRGEVREHGKIANTPTGLRTLAAKLARRGQELRFCYEAGPCGYGIHRQLSAAGHGCVVVAPSLIPRRAGERSKTDRRDATNLAMLHRAGGAARRMLIEAAWSYRFPARISREQLLGQEGLAKPIRDIAWKAQAVSAVSQACAGRQATDSGHRRDRARTGRLRLGDRKTGASRLRVMRRG